MMSKINEDKLKQELKLGNIKNFYFIFGEEKYLVEYYTKKVVDATVENSINDFNFKNFSSDNLNLYELSNAIESISFMSSKKCVKISNLEIDKLNSDEIKSLKSIISDLPESTVLVISQTATEVNTKKSAKWSSFLKICEKCGDVLECAKLSKSELTKHIMSWAKKAGSELSFKNAQALVDFCPENLLDLKNEVQKLAAFKYGSEITREDIDALTEKKLEANIFELSKLIFSKSKKEAINNLHALLYKKEEPTVILSILAGVFIDVYRAKVALNSNKSVDTLTKFFNYKGKEFRLNIASRYAKNISIDSIISCIEILAKTDFKLKSSRVENKILMEEVASRLIFELHE